MHAHTSIHTYVHTYVIIIVIIVHCHLLSKVQCPWESLHVCCTVPLRPTMSCSELDFYPLNGTEMKEAVCYWASNILYQSIVGFSFGVTIGFTIGFTG